MPLMPSLLTFHSCANFCLLHIVLAFFVCNFFVAFLYVLNDFERLLHTFCVLIFPAPSCVSAILYFFFISGGGWLTGWFSAVFSMALTVGWETVRKEAVMAAAAWSFLWSSAWSYIEVALITVYIML